jgi:methylenetetrahydrofolate--tRNA-(uracil-5-)-methyltransferase
MNINVIGAGLAGSEAAFFLAERDLKVTLYEMRSKTKTPAHTTDLFGELVCSNSLKSVSIENAHGLLKKEMEIAKSFIIKAALETKVPAGNSLSVDRKLFAEYITEKLKAHKNIKIVNEEVTSLKPFIQSGEPTVIATGPLSSEKILLSIKEITGDDALFFFDAEAPIVDGGTINYDKVFFQSRYDKGEPDFLNAPFSKEEYYNFVGEIQKAEKVEFDDFENKKVFEGCLPIETLASRGDDTLAFGPMKPVGLRDPKTGKQAYAVVQMRSENINKSIFNLVGFQTRMKWKEQDRVFRMIPGLENAEFLRYGVMHKNSFLDFPKIIDKEKYSFNKFKNIYFAGQITGVEGYAESAASGLFTAYAFWANLNNKPVFFPEKTMLGALQKYTITENPNYQPMPSNFGLLNYDVFNEKGKRLKGRDKKLKLAENALAVIENFITDNF